MAKTVIKTEFLKAEKKITYKGKALKVVADFSAETAGWKRVA